MHSPSLNRGTRPELYSCRTYLHNPPNASQHMAGPWCPGDLTDPVCPMEGERAREKDRKKEIKKERQRERKKERDTHGVKHIGDVLGFTRWLHMAARVKGNIFTQVKEGRSGAPLRKHRGPPSFLTKACDLRLTRLSVELDCLDDGEAEGAPQRASPFRMQWAVQSWSGRMSPQ